MNEAQKKKRDALAIDYVTTDGILLSGEMTEEFELFCAGYDTAIEQAKVLEEALRKAILWGECVSARAENRSEINWTYLNEAREALAAWRGGGG